MKRVPQEVLVCTMQPYFLYLPVSYAIGTNCFGLLNRKYVLKEKQAWPAVMRTDAGVRHILSSDDRAYKNVWFGLCDPVELLKPEAEASFRGLRVLATIVSSSAFWAVNHNSEKCKLFSDLARFDKIIAYRSGTTSHGIATSIVKHKTGADPIDTIIEVEPGGEQRRFEKSGAGTLMISPSVDTVEWLIAGNRNYHVMLDIAITQEYSNVLTTALLVREEVIRDHKELVEEFLVGIQLALNKIHERHEEALTFARQSTEFGDYADQALSRAIRSRVIPHDIEVKTDSWFRAAEKYFHSVFPHLEPAALTQKLQYAAEVCSTCIESVADENEAARERARHELRKGGEKKPKWLGVANVCLGIVIGCALTFLGFYGPITESFMAVGFICIGGIVQALMKLQLWSTLSLYHWIAFVMVAAGAVTLHGGYVAVTASLSLLTGGTLFWLASFRTRFEQNAQDRQ